ncbi:PQQ-binding-like beta-propeller repeat protein [Streptomyces sp. NPDC087425]|uniref:outer membrane protein assembly factor BamB family protein n=1 Tax=Streptomyces sp. NPDC087425 TaxID=3365787 RepID=UPI00380E32F7
MTQPPPPPPHQPPQQGGFGPPQPPQQPQPPQGAPQQPGQGHPQAPPPPAQPPGPPQPQPGYGYPQAPPQAPQAPQPPQPPAGYGYPGQPPAAPYGQPGAPTPPAQYQQPTAYAQPNPYGQQPPGYGYPGQQPPGYGYPGQPPTAPMQAQGGQPGGGRKFNAQVAIIVSAVVAIALIIGLGAWYAAAGGDDGKKNDTATSSGGSTGGQDSKGGDDSDAADDTTDGVSATAQEKVPASTASKQLFKLPAPTLASGVSQTRVLGSWITDKAYVKSGVDEIVGYDRDTGTKLWSIPLSGPVCAASPHLTTGGLTAVVYESAPQTKAEAAHECSQVAALDLTTGKKLWTKTAKTGDQDMAFNNVTVSAGTAAVGGTSGGAAFDLTSGKLLWSPKPTDTCFDSGYGGGAKLVAVRKCGDYGARQLHIQTIDPKTGKVISEYKMAAGIEYASVVSTDPLVVAADVGDSATDGSGISDFFSIDNKTGTLRTRISAPSDDYAAQCDGISRLEDCSGLAVGGESLYIATEEHDGDADYAQTNEVVAFDLDTGKLTGQRADAGDNNELVPLRMDGPNLLAYKRTVDKGSQIVSIAGSAFKQTTLLQTPTAESSNDTVRSLQPGFSEVLFSQGHLYMSGIYASRTDPDQALAIGFATS